MKVRRLILVLALVLIVCGVGAKQGLAYMQETYGGACTQLSGVPGLLQQMNLVATGNCAVNSNNKCKNPSFACTIPATSGPGTSGICTNGPKLDCACKPNKRPAAPAQPRRMPKNR